MLASLLLKLSLERLDLLLQRHLLPHGHLRALSLLLELLGHPCHLRRQLFDLLLLLLQLKLAHVLRSLVLLDLLLLTFYDLLLGSDLLVEVLVLVGKPLVLHQIRPLRRRVAIMSVLHRVHWVVILDA